MQTRNFSSKDSFSNDKTISKNAVNTTTTPTNNINKEQSSKNLQQDKDVLTKLNPENKNAALSGEERTKFKQTVSKMQFEEAFEQLKEISNYLDSGEASLSQTMRYLELAVILKSHCKKILEGFRLKVEEILAPEK